MEEYKNGKIERVLGIYTKLLNGYIVNKAAEANYLILLTLLSYYTIIVRGQNNDFKELRGHYR